MQGEKKQLKQGKSSNNNMVTRIGGNVFSVTSTSDRETVVE